MTEFARESDLVPRLLECSDSTHLFATEVPLFQKMIDLYAYDKESGSTVAYELKLRDWKRGLTQATPYLLCADFVYLAVPKRVASRVLSIRDIFDDLGIGLLAVDGVVDELVSPRQSDRLLERCKRVAIAHVEQNSLGRL